MGRSVRSRYFGAEPHSMSESTGTLPEGKEANGIDVRLNFW